MSGLLTGGIRGGMEEGSNDVFVCFIATNPQSVTTSTHKRDTEGFTTDGKHFPFTVFDHYIHSKLRISVEIQHFLSVHIVSMYVPFLM